MGGTLAWANIIHLGHYPYQQPNLKIFSILQGHKNPHRKIFGTRYIIINMKLIIYILEVREKDCHLKKDTEICVII